MTPEEFKNRIAEILGLPGAVGDSEILGRLATWKASYEGAKFEARLETLASAGVLHPLQFPSYRKLFEQDPDTMAGVLDKLEEEERLRRLAGVSREALLKARENGRRRGTQAGGAGKPLRPGDGPGGPL